MTWEGYNYEDAVLLSERSSTVMMFIHLFILKNMKSEARDTKLGPEEITRDIPSAGR